jgi:ABC-2 type transport system permease protein
VAPEAAGSLAGLPRPWPWGAERRARPCSDLAAAGYFARRLLLADLRNVVVLAITLFSPLLVLVLFRLIGTARDLAFLFPAMVGFSVMLFGGWPAQRIALWHQQGVFERLACAPVPPGFLVLAVGLVQVAVSVAQAFVLVAVGTVGLDLAVDPRGLVLALPVLAVGAACFIAYGSLIACLTRRPEIVNVVYMFTVVPMAFLGNTVLPSAKLPPVLDGLRPWLPTALLAHLVGPTMQTGSLPGDAGAALVPLVAYTALFALAAVRMFRVRS